MITQRSFLIPRPTYIWIFGGFWSCLSVFAALVKRFHDEWWRRRLRRLHFGPLYVYLVYTDPGGIRNERN